MKINYRRYRKELEKTYEGTCTVAVYAPYKDPVTKQTKHQEVQIFTDQPCRKSFKNIASVDSIDPAARVVQVIALFLSPELTIPPGSKITVTQSGEPADYTRSGEPAVYPTHQEIILELFKGWA